MCVWIWSESQDQALRPGNSTWASVFRTHQKTLNEAWLFLCHPRITGQQSGVRGQLCPSIYTVFECSLHFAHSRNRRKALPSLPPFPALLESQDTELGQQYGLSQPRLHLSPNHVAFSPGYMEREAPSTPLPSQFKETSGCRNLKWLNISPSLAPTTPLLFLTKAFCFMFDKRFIEIPDVFRPVHQFVKISLLLEAKRTRWG